MARQPGHRRVPSALAIGILRISTSAAAWQVSPPCRVHALLLPLQLLLRVALRTTIADKSTTPTNLHGSFAVQMPCVAVTYVPADVATYCRSFLSDRLIDCYTACTKAGLKH